MTGFSGHKEKNKALPRRGLRLWALAIAGLLMIGLAGVGDARAQSRGDLAAINKKLTQIEKQLRAVQRVAFPDGQMAQDFAAARGPAGGNASGGTLLADIEVRLGRIDTQMRQLTGSIEELAHRQRQLENKFENFRGDIEFRFREMAGGSQGNSGDGRTGLAGTSPSAGNGLVETPTLADAEALLASQRARGAGADTEVSALNNAPVRQASILPAGSAEERYQFAFALLRKGDYESAEAAFRAFVDQHSDHRLAGNAQYWLGETYYVRKDYPRAAAAFLAGFQNYGEGSKGPDSLVKLGLTLSNMGQNEDACAAFYEIEVSYPDAGDNIMKRITSEKARLDCQ